MTKISGLFNSEANPKRNLIIISTLILAITTAHYSMSHSVIYLHDISRRLYYLPIILAGLWFGKKGGVYSAAAITILYFPHALFAWYGRNPRYLDNIIEIIFFNVVGFLIGIYIERRNLHMAETEKNARKLKQAYERLKQNSERLRYLEERLRFADRLSILGELSASLAHEIRNPLGGIRGAAEILQKRTKANPQLAEFAEIQIREIQRLNQVVENYLALAKKENTELSPAQLIEVVKDTLELVRISARKNGITMHTDFPKAGITVRANTLQLQQVILNLTLNGIQAMPAGGRLDVTVSRNDNHVLLAIRDEGKGIPRKDRDKLFTAFFTSKKEGTGLGLSIVKRIVQQHRGRVWFESSTKGSTFFVELPLEVK